MIEQDTGHYAVPCSVTVVVISDNRALLGLNNRGEWELPGGWPDREDTTITDTAVREVHEETGIHLNTNQDASAFELVGAELFTPVPGRQVALVCFATELACGGTPRRSAGHHDVAWHPVTALPTNLPEIYRRFIMAAVSPA